jgi:pimeloyl-ACP methyl ester carboxylesterase
MTDYTRPGTTQLRTNGSWLHASAGFGITIDMSNPADEGLSVVLVHGLWHGAWVWDEVRDYLSSAGIASVAVELPMTDLAADVVETTRALDDLGRPAVLVGHSYGGAVITAAGSHPLVRHLIYLAAFQLAEGESVGRTLPHLDIPATRLGEAVRYSDTGDEVSLDPTIATEIMYADVSPAKAAAAIARLRPVHRPVFRGVPATIAWNHTPSTYVVCADDLTVQPDLQRAMARRAGSRHEWPGGHSVAATRPADVAKLVATIAAHPSG